MRYKILTVSPTYVTADLSDFPLRVSITSDSDMGAVCHTNGYDVSFYTPSGTLLPHERREWAITNGSVTAEFFVKCNLSTSGTQIVMQYGDASATTDLSQPSVVWSDYDLVAPLTPTYTTVNDALCIARDVSGNGHHSNANWTGNYPHNTYDFVTLPDGRQALTCGNYNPVMWSGYTVPNNASFSLMRYFTSYNTNTSASIVVAKMIPNQSVYDCFLAVRIHSGGLYRTNKNSGNSSQSVYLCPACTSSGDFAQACFGINGTNQTIYCDGSEYSYTSAFDVSECNVLDATSNTTDGMFELRVRNGGISAAWHVFERSNLIGNGGVTFGHERNRLKLLIIRG